MLTELRNRGLQDALIVCCNGLKGLPNSIRTTWPEATVQTCVVHMVRNSLRYASKRHWSRITSAMRGICTAPTVEAAETRFADFADEWEQVYPAMIEAWRSVWNEFVPFLEFPAVGAPVPCRRRVRLGRPSQSEREEQLQRLKHEMARNVAPGETCSDERNHAHVGATENQTRPRNMIGRRDNNHSTPSALSDKPCDPARFTARR
jgi:hypothetical protein